MTASPSLHRQRLILSVLPAVLAVGVGLSGCAAPAEPGDDPAPGGEGTSLELSNCGYPVVIDRAPQRVVTIKSTSTEMLLALGLADRIVGSAFLDGPVADAWADEAASIPVLSDQLPSQEAVLELEPDLVYGGWESNFSADGAGERDELATLGVASYVSPAACQGAEQPPKLDFDELFREIGEVADIFDVDAGPLLDRLRADLAAIEPDERGLSALWYSSGVEVPYVGGGIGAPQMVLETIGLGNVAADQEQTWTSLGWEAIVDADPDIIVLVDASWHTADSKIEQLRANPATAKLAAVANDRYLIVPFATAEAGVRSVEAAASLADQLAAIQVD